MPEIDQIVEVDISATSATPSLPGVDIPAIAAFHTHYTDLVRSYFDPSGMVADGFGVHEPAYLMATSLVSQNPRPAVFKVIRMTQSVSQVMHFKVTDHQDGHLVGLFVTDASGVAHAIQNLNSGQTNAQIATALAAISVPGATLAVNGGDPTMVDISVSAAAAIWYPSGVFGGDYSDTTSSVSPGADLDAAILVDPNFYTVTEEHQDAQTIADMAVWCEANKRPQVYTTAETANINTSNSGIFHTLHAAADNFSYGQYSGTPITYAALALAAQRLTADPGSDTWAFKTLAGVQVDNLTPTQISNALANKGNVYVPVANLNVTLFGTMASGQFADIRRGLDALSKDIQIRVFGLLASVPKVPYTRKGIALVGGEVFASLQSFVNTGFLSNDSGFEPQVAVPDLAQVAPADKANRVLRNVKFTATAQGAVHTVKIQGTLNF